MVKRFFFVSVVVLVALIVSIEPQVLNEDPPQYFGHNYYYRLIEAHWVRVAENQTEIPWHIDHVCELDNEGKIKLCTEALEYPTARKYNVSLVEGQPAGEALTYEIKLRAPIKIDNQLRYNFNPTLVLDVACACPTNPPMYLRDYSDDGSFEDVYVGYRQKYGETPDRTLPEK